MSDLIFFLEISNSKFCRKKIHIFTHFTFFLFQISIISHLIFNRFRNQEN